VKELRERTNAGFSDCRAALVEAGGDIEKAISVLRKKGQAAAAKKAQREASEGLVGSYIHAGGKIGVLVELNCESDFVARTEAYQQLSHDIAMHIAALDPRYVRREEVTPEMPRKRTRYLQGAGAGDGQTGAGRREDRQREDGEVLRGKLPLRTALHQGRGVTIREMIEQAIAKLGENISIRRFVRFKVGKSAAKRRGRKSAPSRQFSS